MNSPCMNCEMRHEACWADCDVYKNYRVHYDRMRAARLKSFEARSFLSDSFVKQNRHRRKK